MLDQFDENAKVLMKLAEAEARRLNHAYVDTRHLLLALLKERTSQVAEVLRNYGVNPDELKDSLEAMSESGPSVATRGDLSLDPGFERVVRRSMEEAHSLGQEHLGPTHILLGLCQEKEGVARRVLAPLELEPDRIRDGIRNLNSGQSSHENVDSEPRRCNQTTSGDSRASSNSGDSGDDHDPTQDTSAEHNREVSSNSEPNELTLDDADDVDLDSFGSGSGLLYLSLQADDTSLGGILDEIYTAENEDTVSRGGTNTRASAEGAYPAVEDLYAGHELQLCSLPDDVDYLQHLASELNKYSHKRLTLQKDKVASVTLEDLGLPGELLSKILKAGITSIADLLARDAQSLTSEVNLGSR